MSELKAHRIDNIISAYKIGKSFCMKTEEEVYIKSEADKVIAEKDKELRHNKYKRCLAMARCCWLEQERIELIECQDITDDDFYKLVKGFYKKWYWRWLELAEKFKPNNSTAQ